MNKIRVGITGQSGFIGSHLYNHLQLHKEVFECCEFHDEYFFDAEKLQSFVKNCDAIVHLAAVNRHEDQNILYKTNMELITNLIQACETEKVFPHIIFSSSIQETNDSLYGKSKKDGRDLFISYAKKNNTSFTGFVIPNVFGEFCKPNYNSVIATFAYKLINGENPTVITDRYVPFIYVSSLCKLIYEDIKSINMDKIIISKTVKVPEDFTMNVSKILTLFSYFKEMYIDKGIIPRLAEKHEIDLFNTFRSYINLETYFPFFLKKNIDERGVFVETLKLGTGGQVSFSTTKPGITRGNHFHTRKIERFTVIKGKAKISLRKIGTDKVYAFILDGLSPSYVDIPVWFTHNITNIGTEELYTQFWINEWYDPNAADTFFEEV